MSRHLRASGNPARYRASQSPVGDALACLREGRSRPTDYQRRALQLCWIWPLLSWLVCFGRGFHENLHVDQLYVMAWCLNCWERTQILRFIRGVHPIVCKLDYRRTGRAGHSRISPYQSYRCRYVRAILIQLRRCREGVHEQHRQIQARIGDTDCRTRAGSEAAF